MKKVFSAVVMAGVMVSSANAFELKDLWNTPRKAVVNSHLGQAVSGSGTYAGKFKADPARQVKDLFGMKDDDAGDHNKAERAIEWAAGVVGGTLLSMAIVDGFATLLFADDASDLEDEITVEEVDGEIVEVVVQADVEVSVDATATSRSPESKKCGKAKLVLIPLAMLGVAATNGNGAFNDNSERDLVGLAKFAAEVGIVGVVSVFVIDQVSGMMKEEGSFFVSKDTQKRCALAFIGGFAGIATGYGLAFVGKSVLDSYNKSSVQI